MKGLKGTETHKKKIFNRINLNCCRVPATEKGLKLVYTAHGIWLQLIGSHWRRMGWEEELVDYSLNKDAKGYIKTQPHWDTTCVFTLHVALDEGKVKW